MVMPAPAKEALLEKTQIHTCHHCGHKGTDVHLESVHIGGRGYVLAYYCDDFDACWERWKANNA